MGRNSKFLSLYELGLVHCSLDLGSLAAAFNYQNFLEKVRMWTRKGHRNVRKFTYQMHIRNEISQHEKGHRACVNTKGFVLPHA